MVGDVMTVYIEIVFIENLIIDYFLLLIAGKITFINCKHGFLGALFGALYASVFPIFYSFAPLSQRILVLIGMCLIAFKIKSIKELIFTCSAVAVSGACLFGILNLTFGQFIEGLFYTENVFFLVALCSALLSVLLYKIIIPLMSRKKLQSNACFLTMGQTKLNALIDSGNSLYYKSTPVVLINKDAVKNCNLPIKPLIIPYSALEEQGALLGFKPESIYLEYLDKKIELNCVVALCDHKFNNNFDALMHPDLIKECV